MYCVSVWFAVFTEQGNKLEEANVEAAIRYLLRIHSLGKITLVVPTMAATLVVPGRRMALVSWADYLLATGVRSSLGCF